MIGSEVRTMAESGGLVGLLKSMTPDPGLALRRFPITIMIATIFTALYLAYTAILYA